METEVNGRRYRLTLLNDKPYVLRRWQKGAHWHWSIVWAQWHIGLPTGARAQAMRQLGFVWRNDSEDACGWWRKTDLNGSATAGCGAARRGFVYVGGRR